MGPTTTKARRRVTARQKQRAARAFACAALTGMLSNRSMRDYTVDEIVEAAWHFADRMADKEVRP